MFQLCLRFIAFAAAVVFKSLPSSAASVKNVFQLCLRFIAFAAAVVFKSLPSSAASVKNVFQLCLRFIAFAAAVVFKSLPTSAASLKKVPQLCCISFARTITGGRAGVCCPYPALLVGTILRCAAVSAASILRISRNRSLNPSFNWFVAFTYARAAAEASSVPKTALLKLAAASDTTLFKLFMLRGIVLATPAKLEFKESTASAAIRISFCRRLSSCAPRTAISMSAL